MASTLQIASGGRLVLGMGIGGHPREHAAYGIDFPAASERVTRLEEAVARTKRHGGNLACVLLDLDGFKAINDDLGHVAGDDVLRAVSARLRESVRTEHSVFRYGGEEFFILADGSDGQDALTLAETLLKAISDTPIRGLDITASVLLKLHPIRGHPMFVTIDETDWQGLRWRVERPIKSVRLMPVQTVEVEFADETPARQFGAEQMIEVHTVYYVVETPWL